jgi:large repetitive protein
MKNKILLSFTFLLSIFSLFSQGGKIDYDTDSKWFWTLNAGSTWQTADVKSKNDFGWGLTIGKSFNYYYGKLISFDLRGRILSGEWYGQNSDSTNVISNNSVLSPYKDSMGFTVLNHFTKATEGSLELVLHGNKLRERTGWDLYVFGGIGITGFKARGNLYNSNDSIPNSLYNYDEFVDLSISTMNVELDGSYETDLDNNSSLNVAITPSLGFGIGYQVSPRFSLGLEHKTTFTRLDYFDGYNSATGKYENDWFHYTSGYLRFHIKKRNTGRTVYNGGNQFDTEVAPEVIFTNPNVSGNSVSSPNYTIQALVKHIVGRDNINFRQNGVYISNFSYNATTDKLQSSVILQPGQNVFEIIASNAYGTDQKTTVIIYAQQREPLPVVTYFNPASNPTTVSNPNFTINAGILNVSNQSNVSMLLNGQNVSNFTYVPSSGNFTSNINLNIGTNIITVTGINNAGSDSKTTTIIYNPVQTIQPPAIHFVDPNYSPYTVLNQSYVINADVLNVSGSENIIFKQNGNINQNFIYNAASNDFQSSVILVPGQNVFEIIATNSAGIDQASTIIIFERVAPKPPVVNFSNPSSTPYTSDNNLFNLKASVLNVSTVAQVKVSVNGKEIKNFGTATQTQVNISTLINLIDGVNTVEITGTNNDGTDTKQVILIYKKPVSAIPPLVTFSSPSNTPFVTENPSLAITASVLNVENSSNVNVNVNGSNLTSFNFNASSKLLTFTQNLLEGANVVVITGTNTVGVDSKSITIIYKKPAAALPPVVTFIDPIVNPTTVFNPSYLVKARIQNVENQSNIQLKINGINTSAFNFNASTQLMNFNTALSNGANIIEIFATNSAGQDSKSTTIIYKKSEPQLKPVVMITNPLLNPSTQGTPNKDIEANVLNVENEQSITVLVNNQLFSGFSYNSSTKKLSLNMALIEGSNSITIKATNLVGEASDSRTIIYKKEVVVKPPFVTFLNPSQSGQTVSNANYTVIAQLLNIESANQINVTQNGQFVNPNLYNYNSATKEITFNTGLSVGNNIFTVRGTNSAGSHTATTNIIFKVIEKPCEKPVVTFLKPNASGTEISQANDNIKIKILNVSNGNDIQVLLNGVLLSSGNFNPSDKTYNLKLAYTLGQNIIEVVAKNTCGEAKATTVVNYKAVNQACDKPIIQLIQPINIETTVSLNSYEVRMGILNVRSSSDLEFKVNGQVRNFSYELAHHMLYSDVVLTDGLNTVVLTAKNACGTTSLEIKIIKKTCTKPTINVTNSSVQNGGTTMIEAFSLNGNLQEILNSTQFTITKNGQAINYVFNAVQKTFSVNTSLTIGVNTFVLKATNSCGEDVEEIKVTRIKDPNAVAPKVQITNPSTSPFNTDQGAFNVQATTQFITAANQVSMTVNGAPVNANFNLGNGSLSYNLSLMEGNNIIVVNAVNQYGSASDTKVINYKKPVVVERPVIVLSNPQSCPATLPSGNNTISGHILNITSLNQVSIKINGVNVSNFNPVLANGKLNFQFNVNMSATNTNLNLQINAQNQGGSDSKTCLLKVLEVKPPENCLPTVGATFSTDNKTANVTSTKDLSNVVLKYHDGTVQKFDGLFGLTRSLSGTGANAGKCIAGVWIKSGCNQSNDGPGYGEWVGNAQNLSRCGSSTPPTDCKPLCGATFADDSKSVLCTSSKDLMNVVLKYHDGQEQKFDGLSGRSINLVGTGANAGKCIVGVWIKSGCNQSNDGPNYGEWIANTKNVSNCTVTGPEKSIKQVEEDKTKPGTVTPPTRGGGTTKPPVRGGGK